MSSESEEPAHESSAPARRPLAAKSRIRISDLQEAKRQEKWAMLTSYDATSAKIFDAAQIPCLLVGDSAAQAVFGHKSTLAIGMDEMIPLVRAVASSCERALVIADMPFGSYQESPELALRNATRFMKESLAHGVKLEGNEGYCEHVRLLTRAGIPVMAHVGFTPQSEHALSGFKVQGRSECAQERLVRQARELETAGAFACVIEMVPSETGRRVTESLRIPTVGIGAGPHTDAQILVWTDMAGFTAPRGRPGGYLSGLAASEPGAMGDSAANEPPATVGGPSRLELNRVPKFVRRYASISDTLFKAATAYADDVRTGRYPAPEHCYE